MHEILVEIEWVNRLTCVLDPEFMVVQPAREVSGAFITPSSDVCRDSTGRMIRSETRCRSLGCQFNDEFVFPCRVVSSGSDFPVWFDWSISRLRFITSSNLFDIPTDSADYRAHGSFKFISLSHVTGVRNINTSQTSHLVSGDTRDSFASEQSSVCQSRTHQPIMSRSLCLSRHCIYNSSVYPPCHCVVGEYWSHSCLCCRKMTPRFPNVIEGGLVDRITFHRQRSDDDRDILTDSTDYRARGSLLSTSDASSINLLIPLTLMLGRRGNLDVIGVVSFMMAGLHNAHAAGPDPPSPSPTPPPSSEPRPLHHDAEVHPDRLLARLIWLTNINSGALVGYSQERACEIACRVLQEWKKTRIFNRRKMTGDCNDIYLSLFESNPARAASPWKQLIEDSSDLILRVTIDDWRTGAFGPIVDAPAPPSEARFEDVGNLLAISYIRGLFARANSLTLWWKATRWMCPNTSCENTAFARLRHWFLNPDVSELDAFTIDLDADELGSCFWSGANEVSASMDSIRTFEQTMRRLRRAYPGCGQSRNLASLQITAERDKCINSSGAKASPLRLHKTDSNGTSLRMHGVTFGGLVNRWYGATSTHALLSTCSGMSSACRAVSPVGRSSSFLGMSRSTCIWFIYTDEMVGWKRVSVQTPLFAM